MHEQSSGNKIHRKDTAKHIYALVLAKKNLQNRDIKHTIDRMYCFPNVRRVPIYRYETTVMSARRIAGETVFP